MRHRVDGVRIEPFDDAVVFRTLRCWTCSGRVVLAAGVKCTNVAGENCTL